MSFTLTRVTALPFAAVKSLLAALLLLKAPASSLASENTAIGSVSGRVIETASRAVLRGAEISVATGPGLRTSTESCGMK